MLNYCLTSFQVGFNLKSCFTIYPPKFMVRYQFQDDQTRTSSWKTRCFDSAGFHWSHHIYQEKWSVLGILNRWNCWRKKNSGMGCPSPILSFDIWKTRVIFHLRGLCPGYISSVYFHLNTAPLYLVLFHSWCCILVLDQFIFIIDLPLSSSGVVSSRSLSVPWFLIIESIL